MLLSKILRKENNNLDIFRVIAAAMVIYGHAYALLPTEGKKDILGRLLVFDYSGSLAVKVFFFLSGLVVTNSLVEKRDFRRFLISRFFRIWPGLAVVLAAMAFIFGPLLSNHSLHEYFSNTAVYKYFLRGLAMNLQYDLPGVFQSNALKAVNGSLWSIPLEIYAYLLLIALFLAGTTRSRYLSAALFLIILIDPLVDNRLLFTWLPRNPEVTLLAPCFAAGSLSVLFRDKIDVHSKGVFCTWFFFYLFRSSSYNFYFFYVSIFYSILYLSSREIFVKYKPTIDISYGLYLWGWPVQQVMVQYFSENGIRFNQIVSTIVAALLGYISWVFVESRFIRIGTEFGRRLSSKTRAEHPAPNTPT